ncbi:hypothetical protein C0995_005051 [Termitomyces sp. Mi166|nr:hypothetical protein C0995_005051 [Termitomyces sp. Mi166\
MTTRRLPSSRSRVSSNAHPPTNALPRSRSAMSSVTSTVRPTEDTLQSSLATSNQRNFKSTSSQEEAETNIQVVIRCRGRSEREIQDNSPIIVTSSSAKSKDVSIELSAPVSSLGLVTMPPVRTYPFDLVFGPEADQAMIYHEVVSPMLEEVLMGYNCTLFAYGQTGTGKTYTMQGDLEPTPMGNPSANAGMIPRVLFRLFHQLETSKSDFSVKISYIELYNEELRDLLASDLSAPNGSTQPMGMGSKDGNKVPDNGLKIFDDASKRGVTIQGLEELVVKDSRAALDLLTKGSQRRQIAATKFNDHSSRSHSVFSITVHIKEPSIVGEDLLKVGKLNLVDLAGSENIGRSGAENKRAREAGMINQSLLTLGRVINALVDKNSHIPYRESKLTRLLQDSLGGRTKTCIVATISPARSNIEETLSTLDYAIRAKSIRNKPELNQRTTRNSLIKDYVAEIERLKADLVAAREKNGIFFSEETWNQMAAEQELHKTELEEARKQVQIVEGKMRAVRDEFEQSIGLLKIREGELKETRKKLENAESTLEKKEGELVVVKGALEEEVVVRQAHQETEVALDRVASGLKKVVDHSVKDLAFLFQKLERKTAVLNSNSHAVLTQGAILSRASETLSQTLIEFANFSSQSITTLSAEVNDFQAKELETLASNSARLDEQMQRLTGALDLIQAKDVMEADALEDIHRVMKEVHETFKVDFGAWGKTLTQTCKEACRNLDSAALATFESVEDALTSMLTLVESVVGSAADYITAEREDIQRTKEMAATVSQEEINRLKHQNEALIEMLNSERAKGDKTKDELIRRVSSLLGEFTAERDRSLKEAANVVLESNREAEEEIKVFLKSHMESMEKMESVGVKVGKQLEQRRREGKRTRDGAFKAINTTKTGFTGDIQELEDAVSGSISSYSTQVQAQADAMSLSCSTAFDQHSRAKRVRIEATTSLGETVQSQYRHMQEDTASASANLEAFAGRLTSGMSGLGTATESYCSTATTNLSTLQTSIEVVSEHGAQEDKSIGQTPRKRTWDYVDEWELTKPRDTILKAWRGQGISTVSSETFLAEHLPLPEDDSQEDEERNALDLTPDMEVENMPPPLVVPVAIPLPVTRPVSKIGHKRAPSIDTLADARNVYTYRTNIVFHYLLKTESLTMPAGLRTVILLSFVLAVGFLMIILSCALWHNWLPLLVALTFVLAPLPNVVFAHCGSDEYGENTGPVDLGRFLTSIIVVSGFALPIILAHSEVINPKACVMSITGGGLVYGTILAYSAAFNQESSDYE